MSKKVIKETKLWTATWDSSVKRYRVRRLIYFRDGTRKLENKPHRDYKAFDKDEEAIQEYLERLNYRQLEEEKAKKAYKVRTSFIKSEDTNILFEEWMFNRTGNEVYSRNVASSVRRYLIGYFQEKKLNYDYKTWVSIKLQADFVQYLKNKSLAHKTIMTIKNNSNMFFQFLHEESKGGIELMKFTFPSLTRSGVRRYEKKRIKDAKGADKRISGKDFIDEDDFKIIYNQCLSLDSEDSEERYQCLLPLIWMGYNYGLRRSEIMALDKSCLRKKYLIITKQLKKKDTFGELKHGAEQRKIPHYFTEEKLEFVAGMLELIEEIDIHPTTFTKRWGEIMDMLGMSYTIHNLRNSFVTRCFMKNIPPIEIMYCAGHTDVRTTMKYARDPRKLEEEERLNLKPKGFDLKKAV